MAYIRTDFERFDNAIIITDEYVDLMKSEMANAGGEVNVLATTWQGADSEEFKTRWNTVTEEKSAYIQMVKAVDSYSSFLRFALNKYKDAQANAINRANSLPRW